MFRKKPRATPPKKTAPGLLPEAVDFQSDSVAFEERPLPRSTRVTLYLLLFFLLFAFVWSCLADVDKIVSAPGVIVTTGKNLNVAPLHNSIVKSIEVSQGEVVRTGQILVNLDPTFTTADVAQSAVRIRSLSLKIQRLESELSGKPFKPESNIFVTNGFNEELSNTLSELAKITPEDVALQQSLYEGRMREYASKMRAYDERMQSAKTRIASLGEQAGHLRSQTSFTNEMLKMRKEVFSQGADTRLSLLEAERQYSDYMNRLTQTEKDLAATRHEFEQAAADRDAFISTWRNDIGKDLTDTRRERDALVEEGRKNQRLKELSVLTAPVEAIVLEVKKFNIGSVVKEGEAILTLVPLNDPLEAQIYLDPADIGYVRVNDMCRMKLDTFPFQKHGVISGNLKTVGEDATQMELPSGEKKISYLARVSLTDTRLKNVPPDFRLVPGMSLSADITVGTRRVITFLIYPLMRMVDESFREP